jgi:hypothetical protein
MNKYNFSDPELIDEVRGFLERKKADYEARHFIPTLDLLLEDLKPHLPDVEPNEVPPTKWNIPDKERQELEDLAEHSKSTDHFRICKECQKKFNDHMERNADWFKDTNPHQTADLPPGYTDKDFTGT